MSKIKNFFTVKSSPHNAVAKFSPEERKAIILIVLPWLLVALVLGWASSFFDFFIDFDVRYRGYIADVFDSINTISFQNENPATVRVVSYYFICTSLLVVWLAFPYTQRSASAYKKDKLWITVNTLLLVLVVGCIFFGIDISVNKNASLSDIFHFIFRLGWCGVTIGLFVLYFSFVALLSIFLAFFRR